VSMLATCYITALALRIVINLSYKWFVEPDWQAQTLFELFGGALSTTYLLLCWSVLYFGIKSFESQRKHEQAMLKAVALAQEAQLKMLRYQLNPHFLFNTLNAISTLILDNQNRKANHAVTAREQGGLVRIEGRIREGLLELSVIDDGPGLREGATTGERRGVGLSNTRERLAVLYGENHRFAVLSRQPGLRIEMALPLESAAAGPQAAAKPQAVPAGAARGAHA